MVKQCWSNKVKYRAISTLFKVNRREHIPLRNLFYSARILQIKNIYNYELAKHVQNVSQYLPDYIINGFNISATTKIRETRQTSKWTNEIPLAETLNERRHTSFRGSTIWNDIPNDFILVNYFRFCRLYKNYFIWTSSQTMKTSFFHLSVIVLQRVSFVLMACGYVCTVSVDTCIEFCRLWLVFCTCISQGRMTRRPCGHSLPYVIWFFRY